MIDLGLLKKENNTTSNETQQNTAWKRTPIITDNKDRSIIRQSSIKSAVEYAHGRPISIDDVLLIAEKIEKWVVR